MHDRSGRSPLDLARLLKPRSVVIVGASDKPGALGASVLGNLDRLEFDGDIHLINPRRDAIGGRKCLPSIEALPLGVDAAVLAIPRSGVLPAVRALAERQVGAVVIFSAGFAEGGRDGLAEQREIARIASEAGMIVEGPNCLGFVNFVDAVPLTFIETSKMAARAPRGIGIVSQSGALAAVIGTSLLSRGLRLSYSVSTGNEAGSGVEDYVDYLIDDPSTDVIGMIVEQFRRPGPFLAAAARARLAGKPIVLLHPGRSDAARESAATHTGAMAGDYQVMKTKVERAGVILVDTLEELSDCLEIASRCPSVGAKGTIVIGESGAFKALTLDFAEAVDLHLPVMCDADSPALRAALPDFVPVSNPVDMTAQGLVDTGLYGRLLEAAVEDARIDTVVLGIIQTDAVTSDLKFPSIIEAVRRLQSRKAIIVAGLDDGAPVPPAYVDALRSLDVPYFRSTERALRSVARLAAHAARDFGDVVREFSLPSALPDGVIPEYRAKTVMAPLAVPFPAGRLVKTVGEALDAAEALGYPVVLKAQSAALSHKSDAGGVIVGLADAAALLRGWEALQSNVARARPELALDGVLVETMGARGLELIVGGRNDPEWGPVVLVGFGGVQAEILRDVRLLPPDLTRDAIANEFRCLKSAALLDAFRGEPPRDIDALVRIVESVSGLLVGNPDIREIDLNPVVLYATGEGAIALDALMIVGSRHA